MSRKLSSIPIYMHPFVWCLVLLISLAMGSGCFLPIYSGDPARRTKQLIYTSENLRNFIEGLLQSIFNFFHINFTNNS